MSAAAASDLRDLYQDLILDHGRNPRNRRILTEANRHAIGHNPICGDKITVFMKLSPDGHIETVSFDGAGCAISVASASMMTDILKGKTAAEALKIFDYFHHLCTTDDIAPPEGLGEDDRDRLNALAGVRQFPVRVKCATLAWHTMQAALCPASQGENKITTENKDLKE